MVIHKHSTKMFVKDSLACTFQEVKHVMITGRHISVTKPQLQEQEA